MSAEPPVAPIAAADWLAYIESVATAIGHRRPTERLFLIRLFSHMSPDGFTSAALPDIIGPSMPIDEAAAALERYEQDGALRRVPGGIAVHSDYWRMPQ